MYITEYDYHCPIMIHNGELGSSGVLLREGTMSFVQCVSLQSPKGLLLFATDSRGHGHDLIVISIPLKDIKKT
jgi:hypothetical protein